MMIHWVSSMRIVKLLHGHGWGAVAAGGCLFCQQQDCAEIIVCLCVGLCGVSFINNMWHAFLQFAAFLVCAHCTILFMMPLLSC